MTLFKIKKDAQIAVGEGTPVPKLILTLFDNLKCLFRDNLGNSQKKECFLWDSFPYFGELFFFKIIFCLQIINDFLRWTGNWILKGVTILVLHDSKSKAHW